MTIGKIILRSVVGFPAVLHTRFKGMLKMLVIGGLD